MKYLKLMTLAALSALFIGQDAMAREIKLHLDGQSFRGDSRLKLKEMIKEKHPNLNLNEYELGKASIFAKSHFGGGRANLVVGNWRSGPMNIPGRAADWNDSRQGTYTNVLLKRAQEAQGENGAWQIHMDGQIKVLRLVLHIKMKNDPDHNEIITQEIFCESFGRQSIFCPVQGRDIIDAELIEDYSGRRRQCVQGRTWGLDLRGSAIWTSGGCRGLFAVETDIGRPGRPDR